MRDLPEEREYKKEREKKDGAGRMKMRKLLGQEKQKGQAHWTSITKKQRASTQSRHRNQSPKLKSGRYRSKEKQKSQEREKKKDLPLIFPKIVNSYMFDYFIIYNIIIYIFSFYFHACITYLFYI